MVLQCLATAEEFTASLAVCRPFYLPAGVAVATVDSWGRRPLLLYGVSGIVLSLLALGTAQVAWVQRLRCTALHLCNARHLKHVYTNETC